MIGILAYGSLITDPGWEILDCTKQIIRQVKTPFPVEYARRSGKTRRGAPTLVPVPEGKGDPVNAAVLVLKEGVTLQRARDILYRRELHRPGDSGKTYDPARQVNENTIQVSELADYAGLGLEVVLFTNLSANFVEILDETFDDHEKAELLSMAARESLTEETFFTNQDGIFYLAAAQHFGVQTRLTDIYTHAILALAVIQPFGNSTDRLG